GPGGWEDGVMRASALVVGVGALLLAACARTVAVSPPAAPIVGAQETGLASWDGYPYPGHRPPSGEVLDSDDLPRAHPKLPLVTPAMVSGLDSGQGVEVRINDRGAFVDGRILDLSYGAARVLGADRAGLIPVRLRVVALPGAGPSAGAGAFTIQVAAFTN